MSNLFVRRWWGTRSRWWTSWTMPTSSSCTPPLSHATTSSWSWSSKSVWAWLCLVPGALLGCDRVCLCCSVEGGELFDRIIDENYNLTELDTVLFIQQITEGLQYMHKNYILHLDLKVNLIVLMFQRVTVWRWFRSISWWTTWQRRRQKLSESISRQTHKQCFCCFSAREHSLHQQSYKQNQNHWLRPGKEVKLVESTTVVTYLL